MASRRSSDLDRDFKPRARPQSMMAIEFSNALDDIFQLDSSLADLSLSIDKKHQSITLQSAELEQLQTQIKKADELIERRRSGVFTGSWASIMAANTPSPNRLGTLQQSVIEESSSEDSSSEEEMTQVKEPVKKSTPPPARPRVTPTRARSNTTSTQSPTPAARPTILTPARRPATSAGPARKKAPPPETSSDDSDSSTGSDSDGESTNPLTQATDSSEEEKVDSKKIESRKSAMKKPVSPPKQRVRA